MRARWIVVIAACGSPPAHELPDAPVEVDAAIDAAPVMRDGLSGQRDRLITCAEWTALTPSAQQVFLTLTHRMYGSMLRDGSHMLEHVTKVYRIAGGEAATATDPGSCGGGEWNRMIMSEDPALLAAQQAHEITDVIAEGYWRASHDVGGPHAPFDQSNETNDGGPRGQTQYFADPTSAIANAPLGRLGVESVIDPYALEMDQDYDCTHNSNPACQYTFYGTLCAPEAGELGVQIYSDKYGDFDATYTPCL
ncbi:MAG: hypothetical protein QM831_07645 [Kofleriaceae bacterium]